MDTEEISRLIEDCLRQVTNARYYRTERGFQGELVGLISRGLKDLFESDLISEQEYQKKEEYHNLTIRPDIIIHEPFDEIHHQSRKEGNAVAIELKLRANSTRAQQDFTSLDKIIYNLEYHLGVFININSQTTHADKYQGPYRDRINFYAVSVQDGEVEIITE